MRNKANLPPAPDGSGPGDEERGVCTNKPILPPTGRQRAHPVGTKHCWCWGQSCETNPIRPEPCEGQVLGGERVMTNRAAERPRKNKANLGTDQVSGIWGQRVDTRYRTPDMRTFVQNKANSAQPGQGADGRKMRNEPNFVRPRRRPCPIGGRECETNPIPVVVSQDTRSRWRETNPIGLARGETKPISGKAKEVGRAAQPSIGSRAGSMKSRPRAPLPRSSYKRSQFPDRQEWTRAAKTGAAQPEQLCETKPIRPRRPPCQGYTGGICACETKPIPTTGDRTYGPGIHRRMPAPPVVRPERLGLNPRVLKGVRELEAPRKCCRHRMGPGILAV